MPVIGRFRLRRESRRAFFGSGFDSLSAEDSTDCRFLLLRNFFLQFLIDPRLNVLIHKFFCTHDKLSTPIVPLATIDYFRGRSLTYEIASLRRSCAGIRTHNYLGHSRGRQHSRNGHRSPWRRGLGRSSRASSPGQTSFRNHHGSRREVSLPAASARTLSGENDGALFRNATE